MHKVQARERQLTGLGKPQPGKVDLFKCKAILALSPGYVQGFHERTHKATAKY